MNIACIPIPYCLCISVQVPITILLGTVIQFYFGITQMQLASGLGILQFYRIAFH